MRLRFLLQLCAGTLALFAGITALPVSGAAQSSPRQSLLVLSKYDHTLSVVDPVSLQVIGSAPVGEDPHEVVASGDGKTAYVSIYGGGRFHKLSVIDLVGMKALPDIDTSALSGPHGLAFVGGKVWFTAEKAKAVARFDPATGSIDWVLGTGQDRTHMLYVTEDQKKVYTTNVNAGTVSLLELVRQPQMGPPPGGASPRLDAPPAFDWEQTVIPVGKGDEGFDVTPNGAELWTADAQDGTISIIDLAKKRLSATLKAKVLGANRLKFTPDGKLALISSLRDGNLVVYNTATRMEVKRIPIGHGAAGIQMRPDGAVAYVACTPDDYVAVIDLKTLAVTGRINAGGEPDGLAWAIRP